MKKLLPFVALAGWMLASCEKNNCYTCALHIKQDGVLVTVIKQPKICRVRYSVVESRIEDSAKTWTRVDGVTGKTVQYEQTLVCPEDNYW
jgi:3-methyladenine DNA glycosylase AlkD